MVDYGMKHHQMLIDKLTFNISITNRFFIIILVFFAIKNILLIRLISYDIKSNQKCLEY